MLKEDRDTNSVLENYTGNVAEDRVVNTGNISSTESVMTHDLMTQFRSQFFNELHDDSHIPAESRARVRDG